MLTLLCAFHGRHKCVERILRCFLNQDVQTDVTLLLFNNSPVDQLLDNIELPDNKKIILVNNKGIDEETQKPYTNIGNIFRDAVKYVPSSTIAISFFDSDDIYLPKHSSEGYDKFKIAKETGYIAYKPYYSYYLHDANEVELCYNNMEPSIFVDAQYIREIGFNSVNSSYHQKWLSPLQKEGKIWQPVNGLSTFIYCWQNDNGNHKISGLGDREDNIILHKEFETDHGDGVLSPSSEIEVEKFYEYIKHL